MPKAFLDHAFITAAVCPPERVKLDFYDTEIKGYILEVGASGRKTLAYRYKDLSGRQCQYKICNAGDLSASATRKQAEKLRSQVAVGDFPGAAKALARSIPLYRELAAIHQPTRSCT